MNKSDTASPKQKKQPVYLKVRRSLDQPRALAIELFEEDYFKKGSPMKLEDFLEVLRVELRDDDINLDHLRLFDNHIEGYKKIDPTHKIGLNLFNKDRILEVLVQTPTYKETKTSPFQSEIVTKQVQQGTQNSEVEELRGSVDKLKRLMEIVLKTIGHEIVNQPEVPSLMEELFGKLMKDDIVAALGRTPSILAPIPRLMSTFNQMEVTDTDIMFTAQQELTKKISFLGEKQLLHFAIMYSNPLVKMDKQKGSKLKKVHLLNDPVNFAEECDLILKSLEKMDKMINVQIECASVDQFCRIVKSKPMVLHIMSHGSYDLETHSYFLEFENDKCELFKMTPQTLHDYFSGEDLSAIKLVFTNACHSEVNFVLITDCRKRFF